MAQHLNPKQPWTQAAQGWPSGPASVLAATLTWRGRGSGTQHEPGQGPTSLRADAQHKGSRQWASAPNDYSRLTITWPISSSPLNTDVEMGSCKQLRLKSQPLENQRSCSSNCSAPTHECPTHPKFPSSAACFPEIVLKDPTYLSLVQCLQEQTQLTEGCTLSQPDDSTAGVSTLPLDTWVFAK